MSLVVLAVITLTGFAFAYIQEGKHSDGDDEDFYLPGKPFKPIEPIKPFVSEFWIPTAAMAAWGLSDAMAQTYAYWLIGNLYDDGQEKARAVGFYKMTQSLGWAIGFALVPVSRVTPLGQLSMTMGTFVVGGLLSLLQLPSKSVKY